MPEEKKKPINFYAFPVASLQGDLEKGVTFRDLAALHLMSGILASEEDAGPLYTPKQAAQRAVEMADALMEALDA